VVAVVELLLTRQQQKVMGKLVVPVVALVLNFLELGT
jgi:hypothetical protein